MIDAYAYLNLTRARDELQSRHAHQSIANDLLYCTVHTRAPDSARIVIYDRIMNHKFAIDIERGAHESFLRVLLASFVCAHSSRRI